MNLNSIATFLLGMKLVGIFLVIVIFSSLLSSFYTPTKYTTIESPWYGICEGTNISVWQISLERSSKWNFNVHRVAFQWEEPNLFDKLDDVLNLIDRYGARVVLDYHPPEGQTSIKLGSPQLINKWTTLVNHYKDDPRIIAWEIFNEPYSWGLDQNILSSSDRVLAVLKAQGELTDAIRQIDPLRPIVWFPVYDNRSIPPEYIKSNIILSGHLYSYGSLDTWTKLKRLADYRTTLFQLYQTQFSKLWLGEFAWHETSAGGGTTEELEAKYDVYIMNFAIENGWGFNYWAYGKNHYAPPTSSADIIIANTNYIIPFSPPKPTNYGLTANNWFIPVPLEAYILLLLVSVVSLLIFNLDEKGHNKKNF